jgi:hypothetical protein
MGSIAETHFPHLAAAAFFAIILRFRADSDSARASMGRAIVRDKKEEIEFAMPPTEVSRLATESPLRL